MKFVCEIDMDNAAFENATGQDGELTRIIRRIAYNLVADHPSGVCMDSNGNSVGTWNILGPREADLEGNVVVITMTCEADVTEEWRLLLTDEQLAELRDDPENVAGDLINKGHLIDVKNTATDGEHNREFLNWKEA